MAQGGKGLGRSREQEGVERRGEERGSEKEMDGGREIGDGCLMLVWRDEGEGCGDKDQVERGRDKGKGDRDNGKGKLGPGREGQMNRQTEGKSRIETWDGQAIKNKLVCNSQECERWMDRAGSGKCQAREWTEISLRDK